MNTKKNQEQLLMIYTECFIEALKNNNLEAIMISTELFFDKVMKSGLATNAKEWFELGALAQKVHDLAPRAMSETIGIFGKRVAVTPSQEEKRNSK